MKPLNVDISAFIVEKKRKYIYYVCVYVSVILYWLMINDDGEYVYVSVGYVCVLLLFGLFFFFSLFFVFENDIILKTELTT